MEEEDGAVVDGPGVCGSIVKMLLAAGAGIVSREDCTSGSGLVEELWSKVEDNEGSDRATGREEVA